MSRPRAIVIGLGGMGSAVTYHLAKRGFSVTGMDRFSPPHDRGSSYGSTRLIRQAYFEDPRYIPLLKKAYDLWDELMAEGYPTLLHKVGLLVMSREQAGVAERIVENAKHHDIAVERLDHGELRRRFPQFQLSENTFGVWESNAGFVEAEPTLAAHLALSAKLGARLQLNETVLDWESSPSGVSVVTQSSRYEGDVLCLCTGAWTQPLLGTASIDLTLRRGPQFWFRGQSQHTEKAGMPCFAFAEKEHFIYGFPGTPQWGVKIANYTPSTKISDPSDLSAPYTLDELQPVQNAIQRHLPGLALTPTHSHICKYTLTQDENFLIDRHPSHSNVFVASGGSGHAFKFIPLIGHLIGEMAAGTAPEWDTGFFGFKR